MEFSTELINSNEIDQHFSDQLKSASLEFQKIIKACREKGCEGDCITIIDELKELVALLQQRIVPLYRQIEDTYFLPKNTKKEKDKISVKQREGRKRKFDACSECEKVVLDLNDIPKEKWGYIAGKRKSNIERLEKLYGVRVYMPDKCKRAAGGGGPYLKGMPDQVAAAKRDIMDNLPIMQAYPVEKRFFGAIIGCKGKTIQALRRHYRVGISFRDEKEVVIFGTERRCDNAWRAIRSIVDNCKKAAGPVE